MRTRTARRIAWSLWGLSLALLGGGLLLTWLNRSALNSDTATLYGVLVLASLGYSTVGALIASRRPDNPIGWIFCVMAVGFAGTMFSQEYAVRGIATAPHSLPAVDWIGYQAGWLLLLGTAPIILVFLLFPSARYRRPAGESSCGWPSPRSPSDPWADSFNRPLSTGSTIATRTSGSSSRTPSASLG
jgi:hypothetical protein